MEARKVEEKVEKVVQEEHVVKVEKKEESFIELKSETHTIEAVQNI